MINISICAQNKLDIDIYKKKLLSIFSYNKCAINITCHINCGEYYSKYKNLAKDQIVLLVIKGSSRNWINTLKETRKFDKSTSYIIISDNLEYAIDGYKINAFDYLIEPVSKNDLQKVFRNLMQYTQVDSNLEVCISRERVMLDLNNVLYFESINRRIIAHMTNKTLAFYGVFTNLAKDVIHNGFIRCHQSFIVNLMHVSKHNNTNIVISHNNSIIPISRYFKDDFMKAYNFCYRKEVYKNFHQLKCLFCNKNHELSNSSQK